MDEMDGLESWNVVELGPGFGSERAGGEGQWCRNQMNWALESVVGMLVTAMRLTKAISLIHQRDLDRDINRIRDRLPCLIDSSLDTCSSAVTKI